MPRPTDVETIKKINKAADYLYLALDHMEDLLEPMAVDSESEAADGIITAVEQLQVASATMDALERMLHAQASPSTTKPPPSAAEGVLRKDPRRRKASAMRRRSR